MVRRKLSAYWRRFLLGWVLLCCLYTESQGQNHSGQSIVKIGALFSFNSKAGKSIRMALELALDEVNEDPTLLNGTKLALVIADSNCSALQGASAAIDLVDKGVVAIIGPQTSVESYFVAHIAEATQVPLVSFSATDPALSQLQYPYFTRVIPSDARQMAAIAAIVDYYGWKEVVALCTDDDFGKNAIQALRNALAQFGSRIVYTAAINPNIGGNEFSSLLIELKQMNTRVFVVHMKPNLGQALLSVATHLRMLSTGYVWLVTDSISNMLGTRPHGVNSLEIPQGIVGSRNYVPMSTKLKYIQSKLKNRVWGTYLGDQFISTDALYAYDALWMVAKAIDSIMGHQKHGSFASPASVTAMSDGNSDLAKAKVFNDGPMLLHKILGTRISGVTGSIGLDAKGDCLNSTFEIVNRVGSGLKVVGYWTPETGCLTIPPPPDNAKGAFNATKGEKALGHVIWPGGSTKIPNGQVDPRGGKPLRILVPNKSGLRKFVGTIVDAHNKTRAYGFCVEVFEAAVSQLPYNVSYTYTAFGTGSSTPIYEDLIEKVAKKEFDAAVGDIAITTKRSKTVDFTQPFAMAGLMVVVPKRDNRSTRTWEFLKPFALSMYFTMAAFVVFTAIVMWILEHRINKAFQKSPKKATLWMLYPTKLARS